jgi:hypothetical protein
MISPEEYVSQPRPQSETFKIRGDGANVAVKVNEASFASKFFADRLPAEIIDAPFLNSRTIRIVADFCRLNFVEPIDIQAQCIPLSWGESFNDLNHDIKVLNLFDYLLSSLTSLLKLSI